MSVLAKILKPYSEQKFLEYHWTSKAVFIPSEDERKFADLFSWQKLTNLLNFHQFKYPELRLALDGKVLEEKENANLSKWCQSGATLIIDKVHKLVPEITNFTSEVRQDLGYSAQVNSYCSWPSKQGFSCHYDTHEVFILQIEGNKEWYVFSDTLKYPLTEQKSASETPPEGEPYLKCTLTPGDVLYIPRGHWHYAVALDQPSLHLTLGIHCQTGVDFLDWLVSELRQNEAWRKSLPLRFDAAPLDQSINNLIENFKEYLTNSDIQERYNCYLDGLVKPLARYSLPAQAGFNIFPNGVETRFRNPKFKRLKISQLPDDNGYKIIVSGKEIALRGVTDSLVENLFTRETFTGSDVMTWLPDFDWEVDVAPLLTHLVTEGIIFVDTRV